MLRKIAGPMLVFSGSSAGSPRTYPFTPSPGGQACNRVRYEVVVTASKDATPRVAVKLRTAPTV